MDCPLEAKVRKGFAKRRDEALESSAAAPRPITEHSRTTSADAGLHDREI